MGEFDQALNRFINTHGEEAAGVLVEWVPGEDDDRAAFALETLRRGHVRDALPRLERLLWETSLPGFRRLSIACPVRDLGGEVDDEELHAPLKDPDAVGITLFERALDRSNDPMTVGLFLETFQRIYPDRRGRAVKDMEALGGDPRLAALTGPLLFNHHRLIGTELARLLASACGPLARRWAWEFSRVFPSWEGLVSAARPAPEVLPGRTFHRAYLTNADALGSRALLFAVRESGGGLSFVEILINDQVGIKKALGMSGGEGTFQRFVGAWRGQPGVAVAEVGPATAWTALTEAEVRTAAKGRRFPSEFLAWKPLFFIPAEGRLPWEEEFAALPPDEAVPTEAEAEILTRHAVFDDWDAADPAWESEVASAAKKARKRAGRLAAPTEWGAFLPVFLPDGLVRVWSNRLESAAFALFGQGDREAAHLALRCGRSLKPQAKLRHPLFKLLCLKTAVELSKEAPVPPSHSSESPTTLSSPFRRLTDWTLAHPRAGQELANLMAKILGDGKTIYLEPDGDPALNLLIDHFIFDRPSPGLDGRTPLEAFLAETSLSDRDRASFEAWRGRKFCLYTVLARTPGKGVTVRHIGGGEKAEVVERMGSLALKPGTVMGGRIVPQDGGLVFSPGIVALPEEAGSILEKGKKRSRQAGDADPMAFVEWIVESRRKAPRDESDPSVPRKELEEILDAWKVSWTTVDGVEAAMRQELPGRAVSAAAGEIVEMAESPRQEDFPRLVDLLTRLHNLDQEKGDKPAVRPGPREMILVRTLMEEMRGRFEEDPAAGKRFQEKWLDKPQKALDRRSPREAIAEERRRLGNPDPIQYEFQAHPLIPPGTPMGKHRHALFLFRIGDYGEAARLFADLANNPKMQAEMVPRHLGNLASCLAYMGNHAKALESLDFALKMNPGYELARRNKELFRNSSEDGLVFQGLLRSRPEIRKLVRRAKFDPRREARHWRRLLQDAVIGLPVEEMETLIAAGPEAVEEIGAVLQDESTVFPPLLAVLGERRDRASYEFLKKTFDRVPADNPPTLSLVVENLAKTGPASSGTFREILARSKDPIRRYLAFAGIGLSGDRGSIPFLIEALEKENAVLDGVAGALQELDAKEAIPDLHAAYVRWVNPRAPEVVDVIGALAYPDPEKVEKSDWRIRYRPSPEFGPAVLPAWHGVGAATHTVDLKDRNIDWRTKKTLAEILAVRKSEWEKDQAVRETPCRECGDKLIPDLGVPSCRCKRPILKEAQQLMLEDLQRRQAETIFDAWDQEDLRWFEVLHAAKRRPDDGIRFDRFIREETLKSLVSCGTRTLEAARQIVM